MKLEDSTVKNIISVILDCSILLNNSTYQTTRHIMNIKNLPVLEFPCRRYVYNLHSHGRLSLSFTTKCYDEKIMRSTSVVNKSDIYSLSPCKGREFHTIYTVRQELSTT